MYVASSPQTAAQILGLTMARYVWRIPFITALPKDIAEGSWSQHDPR